MMGGEVNYKSTGTYKAAWEPTITKFTKSLFDGGNYRIWGTQFNGLSQANAFGTTRSRPTSTGRITNSKSAT